MNKQINITKFRCRIIAVSLILSVTAASCGKSNKHKGDAAVIFDGNVEIVSIDPENIKREVMTASMVFDTVEYLPLETPPGCIIGTVDKLVYNNNRYYIFDSTTQSLFIYDTSGRYVSRIDKKGKGPGEYIDISAFTIDRVTGNICIYDRLRKLLFFDSDGQYMHEKSFKVFFDEFVSYDDSMYHIYQGYGPDYNSSDFPNQYRYFTIYEDKIINKYLPYEYKEYYWKIPKGKEYIYASGDSIMLCEFMDNKIYRVLPDGRLQHRFTIDFGSYNAPLKTEMTEAEVNDYRERMDKPKWGKLCSLIELPGFLYISYSYGGLYQCSFYSKATGRTINLGPLWINDYAFVPMPAPVTGQGDSLLLSVVDAFAFKMWFKDNKRAIPALRELSDRVSELDNPILIKSSIKNF